MPKKKNNSVDDEKYDEYTVKEKLYRKYKARHRDNTRRQQRLRKLKSKEDEEMNTLESLAHEPNQYSRLGWQVEFKEEYDNITVTIAPD